MLVCNVSLRPPRAGIAAGITETATAVDATATGTVVFATLVDDPASVGEIVDAYLGEIMLEAASADAVADAGFALIGEILETVTAADTEDGSVTAAPSGASFDPATVTAVTLSGSNLVATSTGTTSADQGARVASSSGKSTGKYYFEMVFTVAVINQGDNVTFGIGTTSATYTNIGNSATGGAAVYRNNGNVLSNGSFDFSSSLGAINAGQVVGCAVDLNNHKIWFRVAPSGSWNGIPGQDPATNTGGVAIISGTMVPICTFGGFGGTSGHVTTANFGGSSFTGAVPSGFTSGWPV